MPLATSDFKQPICVEMNCLRREGLAPKAIPETAPSLDSSGMKNSSKTTFHNVVHTKNMVESLNIPEVKS